MRIAIVVLLGIVTFVVVAGLYFVPVWRRKNGVEGPARLPRVVYRSLLGAFLACGHRPATFSSRTPTAIRVPFTIAAVAVVIFAVVMFLRRRRR